MGSSAGGGGFGFRGIYILTGDGYLHEQVLSTGADFAPAVKFLPVHPGISNGLNIEGNVLYAATSHGCGDAPNALWAIDLAAPDYPVTTYSTKSVSLQASMGPTLSGGVAYLVTGSGSATDQVYPNSIVALSGKELKVKDWYTPAGDAGNLQNLAPVAFTFKQQELLAAPGKDGSFVLLDSKVVGRIGSPHSPLSDAEHLQCEGQRLGRNDPLAGSQTVRPGYWHLSLLLSPRGEVRNQQRRGHPRQHRRFQGCRAGWKNCPDPGLVFAGPRQPRPPVVANGVVIALSEGDRKTNARLYVLDATTGKQLYASGSEIATYAQMSGVSVGDSHAFFTTHDGTLYCFGIGMEH